MKPFVGLKERPQDRGSRLNGVLVPVKRGARVEAKDIKSPGWLNEVDRGGGVSKNWVLRPDPTANPIFCLAGSINVQFRSKF